LNYPFFKTLKKIDEVITELFGKPYFGNAYNSINRILDNRNYVGVYTRGGTDIKDGMPRIVSDELFERVRVMRAKNKKTPAKARAREDYLLTTKLFCGHCRERIKDDVFMVGVSGTSKTGAIHSYYTCKKGTGSGSYMTATAPPQIYPCKTRCFKGFAGI
jgi:hypothetical protein